MKYYVYTIPKAGTYLAAAVLEQAGLVNTGWHIMVHDYLDTHAHDHETNAAAPSETKVRGNYVNRFRHLKDNQFCFGHLSPAGFPMPVATRTGVLRCYRHPREVMEAEFVDFRFRRRDVGPYSRESVADDREAFNRYVRRRGERIRTIFVEFLLYEKLLATPEYVELLGHECHASIDLATLRSQTEGFSACRDALRRLGVTNPFTEELFHAALGQNTKTHSAGVSGLVDRASLWTEAAESAYAELGLESVYAGICERAGA